jgi:hypothetical protein
MATDEDVVAAVASRAPATLPEIADAVLQIQLDRLVREGLVEVAGEDRLHQYLYRPAR